MLRKQCGQYWISFSLCVGNSNFSLKFGFFLWVTSAEVYSSCLLAVDCLLYLKMLLKSCAQETSSIKCVRGAVFARTCWARSVHYGLKQPDDMLIILVPTSSGLSEWASEQTNEKRKQSGASERANGRPSTSVSIVLVVLNHSEVWASKKLGRATGRRRGGGNGLTLSHKKHYGCQHISCVSAHQ